MASADPDLASRRPLLASYALTEDGTDAVGGNPCYLKDIVFEDGAALVRGEYNKHDVSTPRLDQLDMLSFAVSAEFRVHEATSKQSTYWVVIAGLSYRWFGVGVEKGTMFASMNNQDNKKSFEGAAVDIGSWHTLAASVDVKGLLVQVWLDGVALEPWTLEARFKFRATGQPGEMKFMTTNYSNGTTYHGLIRHLRVYGAPFPLVRAVTLQVAKPESDSLDVICLSMGGDVLATLSFPVGAKVSDVRAALVPLLEVPLAEGAGSEKSGFQFVGEDATVFRDDANLADLSAEGA